MITLYAACDVLLFTSQEDNLPNMILEAMACSLPVVAYRVGGVPELVEHGKTGLLADPFDASSLCEHLRTILRNAELREGMGRTARFAVAASFTLEAQARLYRDLYAEVIAAKPELPGPVKIFTDTNLDSFDLALNALEQERDALVQEKNILAREKMALMNELARQKSDFRAELSRLRKWNHYLRRQSLSEFVSRNLRVRWRLLRKRSAYLRKKKRGSNR